MMNIVTTKQEKVIEEKELLIQENKTNLSAIKDSNSQHENEVTLPLTSSSILILVAIFLPILRFQ